MKVVHVIDALGFGGGAEHALRIQLPLLKRHDVHSEVVCLWTREGPLASVVAQEGTPVHALDEASLASRVRSLRSLIVAGKPDLLHATLFDSCLVSRLAAIGTSLPLVNSFVNTSYDPVRVRSLGVSRRRLRLVQEIDKRTVGRVDRAHVLSNAVAAEVRDVLKVPKGKIELIPRGRSQVQLEADEREDVRARVRAEFNIGSTALLLVHVGRHDPQKGHSVLLEAFDFVRKHVPDAVLLLAGREGGSTPGILSTISARELEGSVRVLGDRSDVVDLLLSSDIFLFPSYYEGLGSALLEAMSVALPIVASDVPAIREVLAAGQAGRLIPIGDARELARAVLELAANQEERTALGIAGLERFRQKYALEKVVEATASMYRATIATKR